MDHQRKVRADILKIVRDRSQSGRLVRAEEIVAEFRVHGLLDSEDGVSSPNWETIIQGVAEENPDFKEVFSRDGIPYYFSDQSLSETYAGILVRKAEDPLWMIAEAVRENSRLYPRPVPVAGFGEPPFELTQEEISECLETMGELNDYQDIARTITSIGTPFLYSTRHLEPDHAFTLAEWLDVGQVNNP